MHAGVLLTSGDSHRLLDALGNYWLTPTRTTVPRRANFSGLTLLGQRIKSFPFHSPFLSIPFAEKYTFFPLPLQVGTFNPASLDCKLTARSGRILGRKRIFVHFSVQKSTCWQYSPLYYAIYK